LFDVLAPAVGVLLRERAPGHAAQPVSGVGA
jgi:hypothetical protein